MKEDQKLSVSETMQNLAYVNYLTLTSQDDSDVPSTNFDLQKQGSETLLANITPEVQQGFTVGPK